jgi:energy-coupling factor transporter ATP-binding protein EcfA2
MSARTTPDVFISYSRKDLPFAKRLVEWLERSDVGVAWDQKVRVGEDLVAALDSMRLKSRLIIAIMTPAYFESKQTRYEWGLGLQRETMEGRVVLLPAMAESTEVPEELRSKLYADFTDSAAFIGTLNALVKTIRSYVDEHRAEVRGGTSPGDTPSAPSAPLPPTEIDFPPDLIEQLRADNCILYAGSGLSAPAGLPAWQSFAEQLVDHARQAGLINEQDISFYDSALRDRKTDYVVDEVVGRAEGPFMQEFLRTTFLGRTPPAAHEVVRELPFAAALTTNFDDLLEQTFEERMKVAGSAALVPQDVEGLLSSYTRRAFFVLKLYGSLDRPDSVLVSPAQFDRAVSQNLSFHNFVENLFLSRTILFVGCSLEGIESYLRGVRLRARSTVQHYALAGVLGSSWEAMAGVLERRYGIRVLPYRTGDTEDQLHALRTLAERLETASPKRTRAPSEASPVKRITLTNVGAFAEASIDLHPRVNILLGNNGVGKSTLLRALAVALAGKDAEPYAARLVRVGKETAQITVETTRQSYTTIIQRTTSGAELTSLPMRALDGEGWLALAFPPLRTTSGKARRQSRESAGFPTVNDVLPLAKGDADLRLDDLQDWIADIDYRAKTERDTGSGDTRYERLIERFFEIVAHVLEGVTVKFQSVDPATKRVTVVTDDGPVPLEYVSQGTSSIISWVGVLLQRLYEIYGADEEPVSRYVLVLMDEIDAHMHPAWQRVLLPRVLECFPGMQLIATTHSPLLLNGLDAECILHVGRDAESGAVSIRRYELTVKGQEADDILTGPLFGLADTRDLGTTRKEARYDELRRTPKDARTPEQSAAIEALAVELFGTSAPRIDASTSSVMHALQSSIVEKLGVSSEEERQQRLQEAEQLIRDTLTR